jgi:hypothetical protein
MDISAVRIFTWVSGEGVEIRKSSMSSSRNPSIRPAQNPLRRGAGSGIPSSQGSRRSSCPPMPSRYPVLGGCAYAAGMIDRGERFAASRPFTRIEPEGHPAQSGDDLREFRCPFPATLCDAENLARAYGEGYPLSAGSAAVSRLVTSESLERFPRQAGVFSMGRGCPCRP